MRHLGAIFYFKQGIFYKFYPQENIIRQPASPLNFILQHNTTQPGGRNFKDKDAAQQLG